MSPIGLARLERASSVTVHHIIQSMAITELLSWWPGGLPGCNVYEDVCRSRPSGFHIKNQANLSDITQTWHCPLLPSRFRLLDLGPDIGGLEPEQMHCPGRTGYILESRRSRPETTISNSAIRKARTETETHNRFIDKTSNRVVYFEKQGREVDPSPLPSS